MVSHDPDHVCPLCDAVLEACIGEYEGIVFDGVRCPNGCDLAEVYL